MGNGEQDRLLHRSCDCLLVGWRLCRREARRVRQARSRRGGRVLLRVGGVEGLGRLEPRQLLHGRLWLVRRLPLRVGHAVHPFARLRGASGVRARVSRGGGGGGGGGGDGLDWRAAWSYVMWSPERHAPARYHFARQLRQKPPRIISSMLGTSSRPRRCVTRDENAAASAACCCVVVYFGEYGVASDDKRKGLGCRFVIAAGSEGGARSPEPTVGCPRITAFFIFFRRRLHRSLGQARRPPACSTSPRSSSCAPSLALLSRDF